MDFRPWRSARGHAICAAAPGTGSLIEVSDAFVPEADKLDQEREVSAGPDADRGATALSYPNKLPPDVSEADVLEQLQSVDDDDDWRE